MSSPRPDHAAEAGFSVVEALVALAVFALACVGLVQLQAQSLRTLSQVETVALADMVAQNTLVDAAARIELPDLGARESHIEAAGRVWTQHIVVTATPDPAIRRISVDVRREGDARIAASAHGFVSAPARMTTAEAAP